LIKSEKKGKKVLVCIFHMEKYSGVVMQGRRRLEDTFSSSPLPYKPRVK
jgi:hypothetical protein